MKNCIKYEIILFVIFLIIPVTVNAQRGCCSYHGGVAGCSENGRTICRDGTLSPSCRCTPTITYIYGCTDSSAKNYNPNANKDNGSCEYYVYGCTDSKARNYNDKAEIDDDSCEYYVYGCMNKNAKNYNEEAERSDGSCKFYNYGCMDSEAINYDPTAEKDDNSCQYYYYNDYINNVDTDHPNNILSLLTIGGIGEAFYYFKKKKK